MYTVYASCVVAMISKTQLLDADAPVFIAASCLPARCCKSAEQLDRLLLSAVGAGSRLPGYCSLIHPCGLPLCLQTCMNCNEQSSLRIVVAHSITCLCRSVCYGSWQYKGLPQQTCQLLCYSPLCEFLLIWSDITAGASPR